MKKPEIVLKNDSITIFEHLIEWYNGLYKKEYSILKENYNNDLKETKIEVQNFDEDFNAIFSIGYEFGAISKEKKIQLHPLSFIHEPTYLDSSFLTISEDDKIILKVIDYYNQKYNTSFLVKKFLYDEVVFAEIEFKNVCIDQIFFLGCCFGIEVQTMRENKEIHW